ncbi:MAG: M28 family peptidase [Methanobacteriota archaeon]|nr:MAG: M28 family peptidase [Euryarchaeota archaeon]
MQVEATRGLRNWALCVGVALLVVTMSMSLAQPAFGKQKNKPQPSLGELTEEELAFAAAIGSGEYEYNITEKLAYSMGTLPGGMHRPCGSEAEYEAAEYLESEMIEIGLQNVAIEEFPTNSWTFKGASVEVLSPEGLTLPASSYGGLNGTPPEGVTAEIIDVGYGLEDDYTGKDVEGKLVLISITYCEAGWSSQLLYQAELKGAIGAIVDWVAEEQIPDSLYMTGECGRPFLCVDIGHNGMAYLRDLLASGQVIVNLKSDITIDYEGTGHNVVGYLPGNTNPDEYIIIGGHYDKWWYSASDDSAGVSRVLGIARAMVESGYEPSRTIVFVAFSGEEYGWVESWYAWLQGSWSFINATHPEMIGKTIAYFNSEGGGTKGSTSVRSRGAPETYRFRFDVMGAIDDYFSKTSPFSDYYYPVDDLSVRHGTFSTWTDNCPFGVSGVSWMEVKSTRAVPGFNYSYHTVWDNMDRISGEALAMSAISSGVTMIRLDRSVMVPYSMEFCANEIMGTLDLEAIEAAGISTQPVISAVQDFYNVSKSLWRLVDDAEPSEATDLANHMLMEAVQEFGWNLYTIGGRVGDTALFPHEHALSDSKALRSALESLGSGDVDAALLSLEQVYGIDFSVNFEYAVYEMFMVDWLTNPDLYPLFWADGRLNIYTDVLTEYFSLEAKKETGDIDYADEKLVLEEKYVSVVGDLSDGLVVLTDTLASITAQLEQAELILTSM